MAGFFGFFDYTKPGPGVPKDAPPKSRLVIFFEVFSRKFWNLVKINMLFSIFNIPSFLMLFALILYSSAMFPIANGVSPEGDLMIRFIIAAPFVCIPLITFGPAQAGMTYLLRNYAREEHAFIWWDFKEHSLKNFKESMLISVIDFIVVLVMLVDLKLYITMSKGNIMVTIASGFLILAFVIFVMMHLYIYPLLVTFKLSIKQIYKNALIFSVINFFPNLGILILCAVLLFASFYNTLIGFILFPFLTISVIGLITNFFVYPYLKRYIMDRLQAEEEAAKEDENGKIFEE